MGLPMARNLVAAGHEVVARRRRARPGNRARREGRLYAGRGGGAGRRRAPLAPVAAGGRGGRPRLGGDRPCCAARIRRRRHVHRPARARPPPGRTSSAARAIDCLDAPVSGGPRGAATGTLTIMVGGSDKRIRRPAAAARDPRRPSCTWDASGAGQAAKLCNNLIAGATMVAIAEACAVADREGIDPALFYDLVTRSTGDSRVLRTRFPLGGVSPDHPASRRLRASLLTRPDGEGSRSGPRARSGARGGRPRREQPAASDTARLRLHGAGALDYSAVYTVLDR